MSQQQEDQPLNSSTSSSSPPLVNEAVAAAAAAAEPTKQQQQQQRQKKRKVEENRKLRQDLKAVLEGDEFFAEFYQRVVDLYANELQQDLEKLKKLDTKSPKPTIEERSEEKQQKDHVSLAAKWAPSIGGYHDKHLAIASAIAQQLLPRQTDETTTSTTSTSGTKDEEEDDIVIVDHPEPEVDSLQGVKAKGIKAERFEKYTIRALTYYRKDVLATLRAKSAVTEQLMSANSWNQIRYNRVPSVCMTQQKHNFFLHDKERFFKYLAAVGNGKTTITSSALLPHEIVDVFLKQTTYYCRPSPAKSRANGLSNDMDQARQWMNEEVCSLQWNDYVRRLKESGSLGSTLPVCDVSGSMSGTPMAAAIALSLLSAEVNSEAWRGLICTFSERPEFHRVPGLCAGDGRTGVVGLGEKVKGIQRMSWGMNTNLQAVFDIILERARSSRLLPEDMVKRVIIYSDMQFDQATGSFYHPEPTRARGMTDLELARVKFERAGYPVPELVFWNLRSSSTHVAIPALGDDEGVVLLSGFSGQMLKLLMSDGFDALGAATPESLVEDAAGGVLVPGSDAPTATVQQERRPKMTPLDLMEKLLKSERFEGLRVLD